MKTIGRKFATLLAWACVLGVLFLGAQNANAQGFPVKPKFQDVRIGFNTFAECEAYWGVGECDLTIEKGIFSAYGIRAPQGDFDDLTVLNPLSLAGITVNGDASIIGGALNLQMDRSSLWGLYLQDVDGAAGSQQWRFDCAIANTCGIYAFNGVSNEEGITWARDPSSTPDILSTFIGGQFILSENETGDGTALKMAPGDDSGGNVWLEYQRSNQTTVKGRVGFLSDANNDFTIENSEAASDINLATTDAFNVDAGGGADELTISSGSVLVNGSAPVTLASGGNITVAPTISGQAICRADGTGCPSFSSTGDLAVNGTLTVDAGGGTDEFTVTTDTIAINGTATLNGISICREDTVDCPQNFTSVRVVKQTATDRSSTTTLSSDPALTFTAPASGSYKIDFCLRVQGLTTGTQGFKFAFNRTSVGTDTGMWTGSSLFGTTVTTQAGYAGAGTGSTTGQVALTDIDVSGAMTMICGSGMLFATGGVSYAIQWAQNDSEANATRLNTGSWIEYSFTT